jgi:hypothetical protein
MNMNKKYAIGLTLALTVAMVLGLALGFPLFGLGRAGQEQAPGQEQVAPQPQEETAYTNDSIARLSHLTGNAFIQRASDIGFEECVVNTPVTEGDRLGTTDGRAEVHFGRGNYVRLDNETKIDFLNLPKKGDDTVRIRVWSGNVYIEVSNLAREKGIELHTADTSFYVLDEGLYRIDVKENRDTEVLVFRGLVEAAGEEGSILIKAGQRVEAAEGRFPSRPSQFMAAATDGFDRWNDSRNVEVSKRLPKRYLPNELEDYEYELGQSGDWMYLAPYGNVWVPRGIDEGWRPYSNGRWTWLPLSGWTWLPYEPWGWSTFHYGRWHWGVGMGWYWIPTSLWGPGWVDWWWDNDYFGWAPISYWGYPVVIVDGGFYGRWQGDNYPWNSHALTVIRRDQLRAKNIAPVALRGDALKGLNRITLSGGGLTLRPVGGGRTLVQPIEGRKVLLRKGDGPVSLKGDESLSGIGGGSPRGTKTESVSPRTGGAKGEAKVTKPSSKKTPAGKIKKKDESASFSLSRYGIDGPGYRATGVDGGARVSSRGIIGYPSSIKIDGGRYSRAGDNPWRESSIGRILRSFSGENYTYRRGSSSSSSSGSKVASRSGSSSKSGTVSRGSSSSRGSSPSKGSSSGSVHKK